ncbi:hypothetical protein [Corynebacterium sp.]|uniref:hypothetical protein n=1 Tax=Corynebacterium sp. TaxID=1720 RepID=UPI0026DD4423|nr:hypothetical protein [Corynebacterium sp.]MDO4609733.1 hypothetical protein [Corynebacterium sp.]
MEVKSVWLRRAASAAITRPTTWAVEESAMEAPQLVVDDLCGTTFRESGGRDVVVGRAGDVVIGVDNRYLHRRSIRLHAENGTWMLTNIGKRVTVMVIADGGARGVRVAPGFSVALIGGCFRVVLGAKLTTYELEVRIDGAAAAGEIVSLDSDSAARTLTLDSLEEPDRRLVAAFAEAYLRGRSMWLTSVRSDREVAAMLSTTAKAIEHRRNALCSLVIDGGLIPLSEWRRVQPRNRFILVVSAVIDASLVTADDLRLLPSLQHLG